MEREFNDWRVQGKCSTLSPGDYDKLFFPDAGRSINEAKKFCETCPVKLDCLEAAILNNEDGIWAGTCKRERDRILRFRTPSVKESLIRVRSGAAKMSSRVKKRNFVFS